MIDEGLCPVCKTGKELYELDNSAPECPYIDYYKDNSCPWFVKLDTEQTTK